FSQKPSSALSGTPAPLIVGNCTACFSTEMKKSRLAPLASPAVNAPSCDSASAQLLGPQAVPSQRLPPSASPRESITPSVPASMRSERDAREIESVEVGVGQAQEGLAPHLGQLLIPQAHALRARGRTRTQRGGGENGGEDAASQHGRKAWRRMERPRG